MSVANNLTTNHREFIHQTNLTCGIFCYPKAFMSVNYNVTQIERKFIHQTVLNFERFSYPNALHQ